MDGQQGTGAGGGVEGIVSVDDHLIEPPHVWVDRVPARLRDAVPHVVEEDGHSVWCYEDKRITIPWLIAQAGRPADEIRPGLASYREMRPAYYDPVARIPDLDADGVLASLCFPMVPRYCGQTFHEARDRDVALLCVQAYNDWVLEEWAGAAPDRYPALVIVPLWDPRAAAAEVERTAARGARAVAFSENPSKLGLPSLHDRDGYWDPLLRAADETGLPLCVHFGSSSTMPTTAPDAPIWVQSLLSPLSLAESFADWIFCGKLERHPNLRICLSEGGIGWIPFLLERAELIRRSMAWAKEWDPWDHGAAASTPRPDRSPAELFRDHVYGCFIDDRFGAANLERIGVDNVMMEVDYPHGDTSFPNSMANARRLLDGYDDEVRYKVMQGNARRVFRLPGATEAQPAAASATNRS